MQEKRKLLETAAQLKSKKHGRLTEREVRIGNQAGGLAESLGHTQYTHAHRHTNVGTCPDPGTYILHTQTQGDADIGTDTGTGKYLYPAFIQTHIHTSFTHT